MCIIFVEKESVFGGICFNWGCIFSKLLLRNVEVFCLVSGSQRFGISVGEVCVDYGVVVDRSRVVVDCIIKGVVFLMRKNGIEVCCVWVRLYSE